MRTSLSILLSLVAFGLALPTARAADIFVSPTGTGTTGCTRETPCSLGNAATTALAGDNVILMDGIYTTSLYVTVTGTEAAWITFKADECATPIIEGVGAPPTDPDNQDGGVASAVGEYLRFQGLVVRGWNIGFGNTWVGGTDTTDVSNGHWDIENCISYSNGRTGFTFFSAEGFHLKNSIAAHNGSSQTHSWSSGVTLFEASGASNLVENTVSFENTDAQKLTDGSGFIVDEESNGVTFINNIAFGNAGSCFRLTRSSGTKFINNTCYMDSQFGSRAMGPSNPGEIYFTGGGVTNQDVSFMNNVIIGTGVAPAGSTPILNQPPMGWSNNEVKTGNVAYFTDATGTNPNFVPAPGDMVLTGKSVAGTGVPTTDIGFDPKCLVKRTPVMVGEVAAESTWQYDIDIDYIKSNGGVAACFNAGTRPTPAAIGAYNAGPVTTKTPGWCIPPVIMPPMGGAGGTEGLAGSVGVAGTVDPGAGGTAPIAGTTSAGGAATAGSVGVGGNAAPGAGGAATSAGGTSSTTGGSATAAGGTTAGAAGTTGGTGSTDEAEEEAPAGCGCRVASTSNNGLGLFALLTIPALTVLRRRRRF